MDIQQTDKESLATYVHRFKWEANRCKFNNDATTIRIFLKGLKNAHTIATKVYEKDPQTLSEAIKEVENLQAAQQITSSLLPAPCQSTPCQVIMIGVSNAKKSAIWHAISPHIRCYDCDNYGHVAMDCLDKDTTIRYTMACCRTGPNDGSRRSSSRHNSHTRHPCQ